MILAHTVTDWKRKAQGAASETSQAPRTSHLCLRQQLKAALLLLA